MKPSQPQEPQAQEPLFWRSLAQLEGGAEFQDQARPEFPEGADLPPAGVSRRQMLGLTGATLSIAGLASCRRPIERIVPYVRPPEEVIPGVPRFYATTMPFGRSAYGLVVESHEGRPTKVEGNEPHPATSGASSTWIQASIYDLYDPDRAGPVRAQGKPSTWDDFDKTWKDLGGGLKSSGGEGLAILSAPFTSPTMARMRAKVMEAFPKARWVTYEPLGDENVLAGIQAATGQPYEPVHHLGRAKVVLTIEADPLGCDPEAVRQAREFADGRRIRGEAEHQKHVAVPELNRLYAVESSYSATGGVADHRLRLRRGAMGSFVSALGAALGIGSAPASGPDAKWVGTVAKDLAANRGKSLVIAGPELSPEIHRAVFAINTALGNVGSTITLIDPQDAARSRVADLALLVQSMNAGQIATLVIVGGNPAYDAPADLGLAKALEKVKTVVRAGAFADETSQAAAWHLPLAHYLESWGDARAIDGTLSIVQPLILPLHGGRSAIELLAGLAAPDRDPKQPISGYDLVRETWKPILGEGDFEHRWEKVLHDGVLPDSALPSQSAPLAAQPAALLAGLASSPEPSASSLELAFTPSFTVYDGRFANIGWLQELPELTTKVTWDNPALMSYATARELGLANEDIVELTVGETKLAAPVLIHPGHAEHGISLALGYGRRAAGRIGNGVGVDAYPVRTSKASAYVTGVKLAKTGKKHALAATQDHWIIDDLGAKERDRRIPTLIREATLDDFMREPEFAAEMVEHPPLESLWKEKEYKDPPQWGMSIDLGVCTGCNACVTACQAENNVPVVGPDQVIRGREMHWIRVDRYFKGTADDPQEMVVQPITCMQCENAPCEQVCPVAATVHDDHGLNTMVYNRCIGTRYCSNNCPYKVRRFNYYNLTKDTPETLQMQMNPDVTVRARGVMEKCSYCIQRINASHQRAKVEGREIADGDVRTACQQACPVRAIEFGDIRDAESNVSKAKAQPRNYDLLAELNVKPRTSYLARIRNPNPELGKA